MMSNQTVIFDLDGTLAQSKSVVSDEIAELFTKLLITHTVAVISGGKLQQFETQFISRLTDTSHFSHLFILPTSGASFYSWNPQTETWTLKYSHPLSLHEKEQIMTALQSICTSHDPAFFHNTPFSEQVEDRDTQITFSGLGQNAPYEQKIGWDPDHAKRDKLVSELQTIIPQFSIRIGGTTSIDITKPGINKAFGLKAFISYTGIPKEQILFIGDALMPGGNDYPAHVLGLHTRSVAGPDETALILKELLTVPQKHS